jgi:hypothetical protein
MRQSLELTGRRRQVVHHRGLQGLKLGFQFRVQMRYQMHFLLELEDFLVEIRCFKVVRGANSEMGNGIGTSR